MARYALSRSPAQSFEEQDDSGLADCPNAAANLLGNGGVDRELLTSVDGRSQAQLPQIQMVQPPLLPEKKRASDGEHSLGTASPALSGFSSPHSGSSLSIPFPNVLPDLSAQTLGTALPGEPWPPRDADTLNKPKHTLSEADYCPSIILFSRCSGE